MAQVLLFLVKCYGDPVVFDRGYLDFARLLWLHVPSRAGWSSSLAVVRHALKA